MLIVNAAAGVRSMSSKDKRRKRRYYNMKHKRNRFKKKEKQWRRAWRLDWEDTRPIRDAKRLRLDKKYKEVD